MKRLRKAQREHLLKCIGEGLDSGEINALAAQFKPAYSVDRQLVDYYRETRGVKLQEIKDASESDALRTGLALKEERVAALKEIARMLIADLTENDLLWLARQRALGSGEWAQFITEKHLNVGEVNLLRAVLDDIAKEMGERTYQRRDTAPDEPLDDEDLSKLTDEELQEIANA